MNVPSQCGDCPAAVTAKSFALHTGRTPARANIALLLEMPSPDDGASLVKELPDGMAEMAHRRGLYPGLDERWIRMGVPGVGRVRTPLWYWVLGQSGIQRSDVVVFSTLCCCQSEPPKGAVRKRSEATCAETWMQPLLAWDPTVSVVGMNPQGLLGDITPLPVLLRAVEKCKLFAAKGERVLLLLGGRAAHHWLGYASNETRWAGHWQPETPWTRARRAERWVNNRRLTVTKIAKVKRLTLKQEVIALLSQHAPQEIEGKMLYTMYLGEEDRNRILALCESKAKKTKVEVG